MRKLLLAILVLSAEAWAGAVYYDSGLLRAWTDDSGAAGVREAEPALAAFVDEHFSRYAPDFEWRARSTITDATHVHRTYGLFYRGRRVVDQALSVHYSKKGWVQYADSTWREIFSVDFPADAEVSRRYLFSHLKRESIARKGYFTGRLVGEPVIYWDASGEQAEAAFEVKWHGQGLGQIRHFVAHELSGRILMERPILRNDTVSSRAWKVSPFNATNDLAPDTVTITGLNAPVSGRYRLSSGYFRVRRQVDYDNPGVVDIDPEAAQGNLSFTTDPDTYGSDTCLNTDTRECPNQRIDGMNVYYHLQEFRDDIQTYFTTLGISPAPTDEFEPLEVYVNAFAMNTDGDGNPDDEANNAGYFPSGCGEVGGVTIERCLIFLKPDRADCPDGVDNVKFYNLAREALVVVHEYQHFVTDTVKVLTPGSIVNGEVVYNVGDALHEGFSDYFAASRVSEDAGRNVTEVGEYGFQNCSFYRRDISDIRPLENSEAERLDPHVAGHSWASGLWQLREELDRETVDLLALKSITFLSALPGFAESTEALVKADQALNGGVNVARIRQIFYDEVKWGAQSGIFRDAASGVVEVGFRSCNAANLGARAPLSTAIPFAAWFLATLALGRFRRKGDA